ncbi:MAG: alpha/beta hydrolase [Desulfobulbaceae bacterium]|nr:alpha/beta hydrolase [Desulfobulbaceae bacterium]
MNYLNISEGRKIRYALVDGDKNKPYLIFLHEGLGCIEMWKNFPRELCAQTGCPGLLYDRTGYGKSSPEREQRTNNYLHDYAFKELPEIIEALIPKTPYILIGHSDGASIALINGSERDRFCKGIVTEAAHVFVEAEAITGIQIADKAFNKNGPRGLQKYHGENSHQMFKAWSETWLSDWFRDWNIESLLHKISCPVLALQGALDQYGTKKQLDAITSQVSGPAKMHMIPDCGHTPHLERPQFVLNLMGEFVREIQG